MQTIFSASFRDTHQLIDGLIEARAAALAADPDSLLEDILIGQKVRWQHGTIKVDFYVNAGGEKCVTIMIEPDFTKPEFNPHINKRFKKPLSPLLSKPNWL